MYTNKMMLKNKNNVIFFGGGLICVIGAIFAVFDFKYAPYVFSAGALILVILQLISFFKDNDSKDFRQKRLRKIQLFTSFFLVLAAYFLFIHSNSWVIAVLIYGLTQFFLSFRNEKL